MSHVNKTVNLNFPTLKFPHSKMKKARIKKIPFCPLSYTIKGAVLTSATVPWHGLIFLPRSLETLSTSLIFLIVNQKVSKPRKGHWLSLLGIVPTSPLSEPEPTLPFGLSLSEPTYLHLPTF